MLGIKILGLLFIFFGACITFGAKHIVMRFGLQEKSNCDFAEEMTAEELAAYKLNKALIYVKMWGMLVLLPGILLIYFSFQ